MSEGCADQEGGAGERGGGEIGWPWRERLGESAHMHTANLAHAGDTRTQKDDKTFAFANLALTSK